MSEVARHYNFHLMMTAKLLDMRCYRNLYRKIRSQTHHTINLTHHTIVSAIFKPRLTFFDMRYLLFSSQNIYTNLQHIQGV